MVKRTQRDWSNRTRNPRVRVRKSKPTTVNLAKRIKKIETREEVKYFDTVSAGFIAVGDNVNDVNAGVLCLSNMAQGDTVNTRDGNKITATSIRGTIQFITINTSVSPQWGRVVIWRNSNMVGAGTKPLLVSTTDSNNSVLVEAGITAQFLTMYPYTRETQKQNKILFDKKFCLQPAANLTATTTVTRGITFKVKIPLSAQSRYQGPTNTVADLQTNSYWIGYMTDSATNPMLVNRHMRFNFKDT